MSRDDEEDRRRIAAAGRAVLDRTHWRNLKTRTVIKEADVSARRFYELFHNQGDLAVFLLEEEFERLRQALVSALADHPVGWRNLETFVAGYLDVFLDPAVDNRRRYYHAHIEGESARLRFTSMRNQVLHPLESALAEANANGEIRVDDPVADARRTYDLLEGIIYSILWADRDEDGAAVKPSVLSFLRRALGVEGPAGP